MFFDLKSFLIGKHGGAYTPSADLPSYLMGKAKSGGIQEITGTLPLAVRSRASQVLENYIIYGESIQDGTPTPDNPVEVTGLGVRTENLFDKNIYLVGGTLAPVITNDCYNVVIRLKANTTYVMSSDVPYIQGYNHLYIYSANYSYPYQMVYRNHPAEVKTGEDGCIYFQYATRTYYNDLLDGTYYVMLTEGPTAPDHYIPGGYKLPLKVTSNGTTTDYPVYIGDSQLMRIPDTEYADYVDYEKGKIVRQVKKLVLTGEENVVNYGTVLSTAFEIRTQDTDLPIVSSDTSYPAISDRYLITYRGAFYNKLPPIPDKGYIGFGGIARTICMYDPRFEQIADLKSYFADQYAAGTPVTVWYALATPIEEDPPIPFPDITLPKGEITIDIDGDPKPQVTIKGLISPIT